MSSSKRRHEASRAASPPAPSTRPAGVQPGTISVPAGFHRYARTGVRSRRQLLTYLSRNGVPARVAARLVAECKARGLVDDAAAARLWADHWARQGYGWTVIHARLEARGFGVRVIEETAARSGLAAEDEARARAVIAARARRARDDPSRMARALAARGFDPDLIERLLDHTTNHFVSS